jgi:PAS domain S-box-containing protein
VVEDERSDGDLSRPDEETIGDTADSLLTFENAAIPLAVFCPDGKILMANRSLRVLLGYEFDEVVGVSVFDLVVSPVDDPQRAWRRWVDTSDDVSAERRVSFICKDGSEIVVRASSVVVVDSQRAPRYVVTRAAPVA